MPTRSNTLASTFALAVLLGLADAQNRSHPGLVHLGANKWGTIADAQKARMIEHQGRWFPARMKRELAKWSKADQSDRRRAAKAMATKKRGWHGSYKAKSKHYRIRTNVPRFILHTEILPFLDALYGTYVKVFREQFGLRGKGANNKLIRIHHGFASYHHHENHRPRTNPGFVQESGNELVVYYEDTDPALFYSTTFHEGAHQFFRAMLPGATLPTWLNEALATYFEGCTYSRATQQVTFNDISPRRLALAQQELRAMEPGAVAKMAFMRKPKYLFGARDYAVAWSLVYYLRHREKGAHKKQLFTLLKAMNGSGARPVAEVFERATGANFATACAGWRDFITDLPMPETNVSWVLVDVEGASDVEDVRDRDRIWSLNGIQIFSPEQWREAWQDRPKDRPCTVEVIRNTPVSDSGVGYVEERKTVTIAPGSRISIRCMAKQTRYHNLID